MAKLDYKIKYTADWRGDGEYYLFENGYGLDTAFKVVDGMVSENALIKIWELSTLGIKFEFEEEDR